MQSANLTKLYDRKAIFPSSEQQSSTLQQGTLLVEGNLDLWDRPILVQTTPQSEVKTLYSHTMTLGGSPPKCVLLPLIYTENGTAVEKTPAEAETLYTDNGGYEGSAKHLGVISGETQRQAITNARDYAKLLSWQQELILQAKFSSDPTESSPGGTDSEWQA